MADLTVPIDRGGNVRHGRSAKRIRLRAAIRRVIIDIYRVVVRRTQRRELRALVDQDDQHLLRDIGLTRDQARREADKWPWQR